MTIRLYLEEDSMRHALVRALRSRGVDVITALEAGMLERLDELHLVYETLLHPSQRLCRCTVHHPALQQGWMSRHGHRLPAPEAQGLRVCPESGWRYQEVAPGVVRCLDWAEERS